MYPMEEKAKERQGTYMEKIITENRQEKLPLIALRGLVMFPKMVLHFDVGRSKSILALNEGMKRNHKVFLVAQRDIKDDDPTVKQMYTVGVVAEIRQVLKVPGDNVRVLVEGQYRAKILDVTSENPYFEALVEEYPLHIPKIQKSAYCDALMRSAKELFQEYSYLLGKLPQEMIMNVLSSEDPVQLAEFIAGNLQLEAGDKQRVLNESIPNKRLEYLIKLLEHENSILAIEREIQEKVREGMDKNQREYFLREQMKAIANELGDGDVQEEAMEYARRIEELNLPEEIAEKLDKEAERLFKMPGNSPEATVIRTYLAVSYTHLGIPFGKQCFKLAKLALMPFGASVVG